MEASIVNRLIGVTKALTSGAVLAVTQFGYDGDGIRVRKSDPSGTTLYPLAGSELALSGAKGQVIGLTEVTLAYTPPAGMGNTGVSADGFDLRKRGATVGWDAGVFDGQHAITQTGFAQVRVETKYSGYRLFGLTTSDIGGGFCPTRYGLELVHGGTLEIYENCARVVYNQAALVYGAGDQLRIEADAGVVRYKRQVAGAGTWQVLYTSTLPVTAALYFNASLYTPGSTLKEIRFVSGSTAAPSVNRTYYTFGGARVAMRDGAGAALTYLHGDQLGSASLATSMTGTVLSQQRYKPYGEVRWSSGAGMPTDKQFTGQTRLAEGYVGTLYDYVARAYDPVLGRFISADTIVPGAGNSQAFNRYAYVRGNPLGRIDPSGHEDCATDACWQSEWAWKNRWYEAHGWFWENGGWGRQDIANFRDEQILRQTIGETGIGFADNLGAWTTPEMASIAQGVVALANKLGGIAGFGTLRKLLGVSGMLTWVNFFRIRSSSNLVAAHVGWGEVAEVDTRSVYFWNGTFSSAVWARGTAVHELGHVMDYHAAKSYKWFSENIPKGYEKELGEYSKNSPKDYFSEALASWVFDTPSGNPYNMARTAIAQAFPPELRCWLEVNVGATACTK